MVLEEVAAWRMVVLALAAEGTSAAAAVARAQLRQPQRPRSRRTLTGSRRKRHGRFWPRSPRTGCGERLRHLVAPARAIGKSSLGTAFLAESEDRLLMAVELGGDGMDAL